MLKNVAKIFNIPYSANGLQSYLFFFLNYIIGHRFTKFYYHILFRVRDIYIKINLVNSNEIYTYNINTNNDGELNILGI